MPSFDQYPGFETQESKGKGKGKGHPVAPEPDATGAFLVGTMLLLFIIVRFINRWSPS